MTNWHSSCALTPESLDPSLDLLNLSIDVSALALQCLLNLVVCAKFVGDDLDTLVDEICSWSVYILLSHLSRRFFEEKHSHPGIMIQNQFMRT